MTESEKGFFWLEQNEKADIRFMSVGQTEEWKGNVKRFLGTKRFIHISREAIFQDRKRANCQGQGCPICSSGHKATVQYDNIEILVLGEKKMWSGMQKSLMNIIGDKMSTMLEAGTDPTQMTFRILRTDKPYPLNWEVTIVETGEMAVAPETKAPASTPPTDGMNLFGGDEEKKEETPITEEEREWLTKIQRKIADAKKTATKGDWVKTLVEFFGVNKERAEELVEGFITDEGEYLFLPT